MPTEKDPWHWTVDEVIHNLFGDNGLLVESCLEDTAISVITNLIREYETHGHELLLSTFDPINPQSWLSQLPILSQRRVLEELVEDLRFRSGRYLDFLEKKAQQTARFEPFSALRGGLGHRTSVQSSPTVSKASSINFKAEQFISRTGSLRPSESRESFLAENRAHQPTPDASINDPRLAVVDDREITAAQGETLGSPQQSCLSLKRVRSDGSVNESVDPASSTTEPDITFGVGDPTASTTHVDARMRENEVLTIDKHGRKRRKLVLTVQDNLVSGPQSQRLKDDTESGNRDQQRVTELTESMDDDAPAPLPTHYENVNDQGTVEIDHLTPAQWDIRPISASELQQPAIETTFPANSGSVTNLDSQPFPSPSLDKDESTTLNTALGEQTTNGDAFHGDLIVAVQKETSSRQVPTEKDDVEATRSSERGDLQGSLKTKRRLQPELVGDVEGPVAAATSRTQPQRTGAQRYDYRYLGQRALSADQIFYGKTKIGKPIIHDNPRATRQLGTFDDDGDDYSADDFDFVSDEALPAGQCLYVAQLMKVFFRGDNIRDLLYGNKHLKAVIPYNARITKRTQQPSMTLFTSGKSIVAHRVNRAQWLRYDSTNRVANSPSSTNINSQTLEVDVHKEDSPLLSIGRDEVHDYDFLEKWEHQANDHTLPPYGDSGSDGEYDLDTWHEMEREKGQLDRVPASSSRPSLDAIRVNEVMSDTENAFIQRWRLQKLPKLGLKAWSLWRSGRKSGHHYQLEAFQSEISRLDHQLLKSKKEIAKERWTSESKLSAQCKSFEVSVADRETCRWKLSILESKSAPPRPPSQSRPRRSPAHHSFESLQEPLQEGEEDLGASSLEESDDSLEDFISDETDDDDTAHHVDSEDHLDSYDEHSAGDDGDAVSDPIIPEAEPQQTPEITVPEARREDETSRRSVYFRRKTTTSGEEAAKPKAISSSPVPKVEKGSADPTNTSEKKAQGSELLPVLLSSPLRPIAKSDVKPDVIDLTNLTDSDEQTPQPYEQGQRIATPPIFVKAEADDPFARPAKAKGFRMPAVGSSSHEPDSGMESATIGKRSPEVPSVTLPALQEAHRVARVNPEQFMQTGDREGLLAWAIKNAGSSPRTEVVQLIKTQRDIEILQLYVWQGMRALGKGMDLPEDIMWDEFSREQAQAYMRLATWFVYWSQCRIFFPEGASHNSPTFAKKDVANAIADETKFATFYDKLKRSLQSYTNKRSQSKLPGSSPSASQKKRLRRLTSGSEDSDDHRSNKRKRRVYEVQESQHALELQRTGKQRIEQQANRQREMDKRMRKLGGTGDTAAKVINTSANQDQGIITISQHIASKIQAHQLGGIRFMWREVVAADQGCLLAHTMGLGKTMQVITLLTTIAGAANSQDESIRSQVPEKLRTSKTLILSPPSLIDNWYDEFLMWAPDRAQSVGTIWKIGSDLKLEERLSEIKLWDEKGGVLLMGYEGFRILINNPRISNRAARIDEEKHKALVETLLTHPNLVVMDEAHAVKRSSSAISKAVARFKTWNRIALTGSPLSNNLEEYYELISWTAPGYLGTRTEFKAKYVEPISQGLYEESTARDRRNCLMKLRTLSIQLEPKMQRQDISVLKKQLDKSEFVIYVPLTEIQRQAYVLYAESLLSATQGKDPHPSKIWGALSVLRLLCNHPRCFRDKLEAAKQELKKSKKETDLVPEHVLDGGIEDDEESTLDDMVDLTNTLLPNIGMSEEMLNEQLNIFASLNKTIDELDLSNKMLVLLRIIAFSEEAQDKVLVFSQSIPTLDFIEKALVKKGHKYERLDGTTPMKARNELTKGFNTGEAAKVCIISTRAGGQGLNLFGANRVVIVDDGFNPMHEEQAIGRAYRIGQEKRVFVYRLTVGGTFEETIQNQSLFKVQLATRVVDKKRNNRFAMNKLREYLRVPRDLDQEDLSELYGKDELVLDRVLAETETSSIIRSILPSETFKELEPLTAEEEKMVEEDIRLENLRKTDLQAYRVALDKHEIALQQKAFSEIRAQDQAEFQQAKAPTEHVLNAHVTNHTPAQSSHNTPQIYPSNSAEGLTTQLREMRVAQPADPLHVYRGIVVNNQKHPHRLLEHDENAAPSPNSMFDEMTTGGLRIAESRRLHSPSLSISSRRSLSSLKGSRDSSLINGNHDITAQLRAKYTDRICDKMIAQLPALSNKGIFTAGNAGEVCKRSAIRLEKSLFQKAISDKQAYRKSVHKIEGWVEKDQKRLAAFLKLGVEPAKPPVDSFTRKPSNNTPEASGARRVTSLLPESNRQRTSSTNSSSFSSRRTTSERTALSELQPITASLMENSNEGEEMLGGDATDERVPSGEIIETNAANVRPSSAYPSASTSSLYPSLQALLARERKPHEAPLRR